MSDLLEQVDRLEQALARLEQSVITHERRLAASVEGQRELLRREADQVTEKVDQAIARLESVLSA